jgi:uncharacterized phage protein (TIGR01671 family)
MISFSYRIFDKKLKRFIEETDRGTIVLLTDGTLMLSVADEQSNLIGIEDNRYIVVPCTGQKDANNKKLIYAGDIVKFKPYPDAKYEIGVIEYYEEYARFEIRSATSTVYLNKNKAVKIIGNIHQNPGLLK